MHDFSWSKKVNRVSSLVICLGKERSAFDTTLIMKQQNIVIMAIMRICFYYFLTTAVQEP